MHDQARIVAYDVLRRIDHGGAYANLVLGPALTRSTLDARDRAFVTDLVYGTTRMRRACDHSIDRYLLKEPQPALRTLLRLGAYQLMFGGVAAHAAVSQTVGLAPQSARGFVNAILRRVAGNPVTAWPDDATRLSYPDWIVARLRRQVGDNDAFDALTLMNRAPLVHERDDGYVQDPASQMVVGLVEAVAGERVLDACAAPGGKATLLASTTGVTVIAADAQPHRVELIVSNSASTGRSVSAITADATNPPFAPESFDAVLIDAPCSGLGVLRRRADARWRINESDVTELAVLQQRMIDSLAPLVRPGGRLIYSVCTLLDEESVDHRFPDGWDPLPTPASPWRPVGLGAARLLPHDGDTDGMTVIRYARPA